MVSTKSKSYMKLAGESRFAVFLKKDGSMILIEKKTAKDQYPIYETNLNMHQWAVNPQRP